MLNVLIQEENRLPNAAFLSFESKIQTDRYKQNCAESTGAPLVVVLGHFPSANSVTPVQVDDDRVAESQDGNDGEGA